MNSLFCLRCGYTWVPRKHGRPAQCPHCHSPHWDRYSNPGRIPSTRFHRVAATLNQLQGQRAFSRWVIIGALAYMIHYQPQFSHDMDILVRPIRGRDFEHAVIPIIERLGPRVPNAGDTFVIQGVPLQVLDGSANAMVREVVNGAVTGRIGDQRVKVASLEHTILLALVRYHPKDWQRIADLLPLASRTRLHEIIGKFPREKTELLQRLDTFDSSTRP
jgi:hypothetical protein